jgi:hypothetical protein
MLMARGLRRISHRFTVSRCFLEGATGADGDDDVFHGWVSSEVELAAFSIVGRLRVIFGKVAGGRERQWWRSWELFHK